MTTAQWEPTSERNLDGYGALTIPWEKVRDVLTQRIPQEPGSGGPDRHTCWLATVGPDGRPHVMPLGVLWADDEFYFNAGAATRKAKNLALNPQCVITVATHDFDLVLEGHAVKVIDPTMVARVAEAFQADGWPASVDQSGMSLTAAYSAPSAGPPPWDVYAFAPETVYALGTAEPYGATRWRF